MRVRLRDSPVWRILRNAYRRLEELFQAELNRYTGVYGEGYNRIRDMRCCYEHVKERWN